MTDGSESDDNRFEEVGSFTTSDGLRLRSAISGAGDRPALVLVHGWTQDLRTWDRVVHELHAAGRPVGSSATTTAATAGRTPPRSGQPPSGGPPTTSPSSSPTGSPTGWSSSPGTRWAA